MNLRLTLAAIAAALALLAPTAAQAATRLNATVGPGFTITLKTTAGKKVTRLKMGSYRIVVRDRSGIHNFRLKGPGLNKATGVGFVGMKTWIVRLRAGKYIFLCDPHPVAMKSSFRVG